MKQKINLLGIDGKKLKDIELPSFFNSKIRQDIVFKVLESKKTQQPYSPSPVAGKQHSASGKINRRRHVWKSGYGRGMSRIPRKVHSRKGSQFIWVGAEVPSVRGGKRAHPPKVVSMKNNKKINKKELMISFISSLSATGNKEIISSKYKTLKKENLGQVPFIVESKFSLLKTKDLLSSIKEILGKEIFEIVSKKRKIRSGKGKMRGRKYKCNLGLLIVTGEKEEIKTNIAEIKNAKNLGVEDLSKGGLGRITIYTEKSIKELEKRLKSIELNKEKNKK